MPPLPASPRGSPAHVARAALLFALAAGPALWLLLPPLVRPGGLPGAPSGGVYPLLHRWWAAQTSVPPRFPEAGAGPAADTLATLLAPLTSALGAPVTVALVMAGGLAATLLVTWRYTRRAVDPWTAAAATAAFTTSPAVVAGITSGDLDAWHGWALLALPLCAGPAALAVGVAIAVVAPTMVPAALLAAAYAARGGAKTRWWPLAGWGLAVAVCTVLGWPTIESARGVEGWFARLTPAPAPERVYQLYVGFTAAALLLLGLATRPSRGVAGIGAIALVGALVTAPIPPERFLHLVPLAAALAGLVALRTVAAAWIPAASVFVATALVAEGWRGVAAPVPLLTASLAEPAPIEQIAEGPVLDLPATRGAIRRALWFQTRHGRPIAADADGLVTGDVAEMAAALSTGTCGDPAALGFTTVVARREGALRELAGLTRCFGKPDWDDGAVAVWRLGAEASAPVPAEPAPVPAPTPGDAVTPRSGPPAPGP